MPHPFQARDSCTSTRDAGAPISTIRDRSIARYGRLAEFPRHRLPSDPPCHTLFKHETRAPAPEMPARLSRRSVIDPLHDTAVSPSSPDIAFRPTNHATPFSSTRLVHQHLRCRRAYLDDP